MSGRGYGRAVDTSITDHLLTTTRAVRLKLDLDRPVDDQVITDCLRIAVQAPTPGGAETWRWLVVRDQEREIADILGCRPVTVRTHLMRALARLQAALPGTLVTSGDQP